MDQNLRWENCHLISSTDYHDDVIKWKHYPRYWPHRWPVVSLYKGQGHGALAFSLNCIWKKKTGWANNRDADDLIALWRHCNFRGSVAMNTPQVNLISYKNLLVLRSPPSVVTPPPPHTHTPHTPNIRMHNMALSAKHIFYKKTSAIWKLAIVLASYNKWTW